MLFAADSVVGYISLILLGYCLILIGVQFFIPHEPTFTSKKFIVLSYFSLSFCVITQISMTFTYFKPYFHTICLCKVLWDMAVITYILSVYTLIIRQIVAIASFNKHLGIESKSIKKWSIYMKYPLVLSCGLYIGMLIVLNKADCHQNIDLNGCSLYTDNIILNLTYSFITIGIVSFTVFNYKWFKVLKSADIDDLNVLRQIRHTFFIQFTLATIAMISCLIDGIVQYHTQNYSSKIVFCLDSAVIASCNFAMNKESQSFILKYICFFLTHYRQNAELKLDCHSEEIEEIEMGDKDNKTIKNDTNVVIERLFNTNGPDIPSNPAKTHSSQSPESPQSSESRMNMELFSDFDIENDAFEITAEPSNLAYLANLSVNKTVTKTVTDNKSTQM